MAVQLRAEVTRQAIMEAAVDQFNGIGYGNTTLADITSRAGITKGAFYYHFNTKESVAAAVIEEAEGRKSAAICAAISTPTTSRRRASPRFWVRTCSRARSATTSAPGWPRSGAS